MPKHDIDTPSCFLSLSALDSRKNSTLIDALRAGVQKAGYEPFLWNEVTLSPGISIQEAIIGVLARSECIIADVSDRNPNVYFELGLAQAMGKGIVLISDKQSVKNVPLDIQGLMITTYSTDIKSMLQLSQMIQRSLKEFRTFPRRNVLSSQFSLPFFIDWEILSPREAENLCLELLSQLGFRKLDWGKNIREADLIAELPRKDPDGFEFREFWLVSLGMRMPIKMLSDIDYLIPNATESCNQISGAASIDCDGSFQLRWTDIFVKKQRPGS